jgi:serralysin
VSDEVDASASATEPVEGKLQLYFDTRAAAVADWTELHRRELETADALIVVVTPGLLFDFGKQDWVHRELRWWVRTRHTAPIVVETTGEDDRWIPALVKKRWPRIQRIELRREQLASLSETESGQIVTRIIEGIRHDEDARARRELAPKRNPERWLLLSALVLVLVAGGMVLQQTTGERDMALKQLADLQHKQLDPAKAQELEQLKASEPEKFRRDDTGKLWPTGSMLQVGFMGGTPMQKSQVRQAFGEWLKYANLNVRFSDTSSHADVRVSFKEEDGSWSYVGTDALGRNRTEASINLGWADSGEPIPINYLHEVGHTLGLVHETSNPNAALRWNKTKVYGDLAGPPNSWSKSQVDAAIFASEPYPGQRAFDRDSIMLYSFPGDYFMDGKPLVHGKVLSQSDKRFIAQLYPGR